MQTIFIIIVVNMGFGIMTGFDKIEQNSILYFLFIKMVRTLPSCALLLIREDSRPLTRPDWRQSKPIITTYKLLLETCNKSYQERGNRRMRLLKTIIKNIKKTDWFWMYENIKYIGLRNYCISYRGKYGIKYNCNNICEVDGLEDALQYYKSNNKFIEPGKSIILKRTIVKNKI